MLIQARIGLSQAMEDKPKFKERFEELRRELDLGSAASLSDAQKRLDRVFDLSSRRLFEQEAADEVFGAPARGRPRPFASLVRPRREGLEAAADATLEKARAALYRLAGGGYLSGNVKAARLTTEERIAYFKSPEFLAWVAAEKKAGRQVFWETDLDKTMGAGDIFTFFFKWRADHGKFTEEQNEIMQKFLKTVVVHDQALKAELAMVDQNDAKANAYLVIKLWRGKENGGEGIGLLDFWREVYWPTQKGLTQEEKRTQVAAFAPLYRSKIYAGVREQNEALRAAGVQVVIVSNGDQELAKAVAPMMGVAPRNVVGSRLLYMKDEKGRKVSQGVNHAYEIFDKEWQKKPQPGKHLLFHYWVNANKWRWKWDKLDPARIVVAGEDGDSASSDGGMMVYHPAGSRQGLGHFIIDTPHEPERAQKFYEVGRKYGWNPGQFFTLERSGPPAWDDSARDP